MAVFVCEIFVHVRKSSDICVNEQLHGRVLLSGSGDGPLQDGFNLLRCLADHGELLLQHCLPLDNQPMTQRYQKGQWHHTDLP